MANKIIVGCKLPHGLTASVNGVSVTFKGASQGFGVITPYSVNGSGITREVDADWFAAFLKAYANAPFVKKELIYKIESDAAVQGETRERKNIKTGMEPIVPDTGDAKIGKVTEDKVV